ncbi:patatin-like phospholipase family protein [Nostoc sp. UCD121]|uniref:patatin-like phospholipase family protein n=1 Tax=unclassified Nostoc TaxID=2593658 RepID=UPI001623CAE1|nr:MULTISPECIES: patatin-like phospholipase family protein [unclassified Nostoc]MBC1225366.1 patatin-like phospholipase family protein [Nostoc sp. UCD120]MBC1281075.1 patatin-like phospholipase family protein [Nostoc sp. UCD121]MBC1298310.1 patatin-like phospholipase family protein [Nostoc sp. UCD122]
MKPANLQLGLVLTGGGAKGAYQVGALQYIAELGLEPQIIAGTSIGALNGAVLSAYHPFPYAVQRLNQLWEQLGKAEILRTNTGAVLRTFSYATQAFTPTLRGWLLDFLITEGLMQNSSAIFDPAPIEQLLREAVNPGELRRGIELWVTVFPSLKIPALGYDWLVDLIRARTGTDAHWLCIQDCTDDETVYKLLLASAALPLAFPSQEVNGQSYIDGGLADNVPLRALAKRGCENVIVIHLKNGAAWNRHDFPEQTVIEIRPEQRIEKSDTPIIGKIDSYLDFSSERIAELKKRGYEDAKRCLIPIMEVFRTVKDQRESHNSLVNSTQCLLNDPPL